MLPNTPATTPVLTLSIATSDFVPFTSCGCGSSDICLAAACPLAIAILVPANLGAVPRLINIRSFVALKFPTHIPRLAINSLADFPIARRTADDAANVHMLVWEQVVTPTAESIFKRVRLSLRRTRMRFRICKSGGMPGGRHLSPQGEGGKGGARRRRQASRVELGDDMERRDQAAARRRPRDCTDSCEGDCGDVVAKRGASLWGNHGASVGKVLDAKPTGMKERKERRHKPVIRNSKIADLAPYPRAPNHGGSTQAANPPTRTFFMCVILSSMLWVVMQKGGQRSYAAAAAPSRGVIRVFANA